MDDRTDAVFKTPLLFSASSWFFFAIVISIFVITVLTLILALSTQWDGGWAEEAVWTVRAMTSSWFLNNDHFYIDDGLDNNIVVLCHDVSTTYVLISHQMFAKNFEHLELSFHYQVLIRMADEWLMLIGVVNRDAIMMCSFDI